MLGFPPRKQVLYGGGSTRFLRENRKGAEDQDLLTLTQTNTIYRVQVPTMAPTETFVSLGANVFSRRCLELQLF